MIESDSESSDSSIERINKKVYKLSKTTNLIKSNNISNKISNYKTTEFEVNEQNNDRKVVNNLNIDNDQTKSNNDQIIKKTDCGYCKKRIYEDEPIKFDDKSYHRFCFKCSSCSKQLDNINNQAFLCEVEQRFYCINCCDCKCWLTNSNKINLEKTKLNDSIKNKLNQNLLIETKSDENLPIKTKLDENLSIKNMNKNDSPNKLKQTLSKVNKDSIKKRCKYCNQILPDKLDESLKSKNVKINISIPPKLPSPKLDIQSVKSYKTAINQNLDKIDSVLEFKSKTKLKEQKNRKLLINGQQEERKIRLARKPVIGSRIAKIINKLENSLNLKTIAERKFQENFYQNNLEQSLEKQEKEVNLVGRLKNENNNFKLDNKTNKKLDQIDNIEQNLDVELNKKSTFCPNCKIKLPTNLIYRKGKCKPFCTLHCPSDEKKTINDLIENNNLNKSKGKFNKNLPYNLLLNSTKLVKDDLINEKHQQKIVSPLESLAVCCKCGLKVYFNKKIDCTPLYNQCLKCSICDKKLNTPTSDHHIITPNNEEIVCNFPCRINPLYRS